MTSGSSNLLLEQQLGSIEVKCTCIVVNIYRNLKVCFV